MLWKKLGPLRKSVIVAAIGPDSYSAENPDGQLLTDGYK